MHLDAKNRAEFRPKNERRISEPNRDRKQTPKGGRRLATHLPSSEIPVMAAAVLPSILLLVCLASFFLFPSLGLSAFFLSLDAGKKERKKATTPEASFLSPVAPKLAMREYRARPPCNKHPRWAGTTPSTAAITLRC